MEDPGGWRSEHVWDDSQSRREAACFPSGASRFASEDGSGDRESAGAEGPKLVRPQGAERPRHGSGPERSSAVPKAERASTRSQGRDRREAVPLENGA